jgi:Mrp family chromosome partitioning ATPase
VSLIAVASAKFSPGATTLAQLLVLRRPSERRCLLVDCDPAGSEWLLRPGLAPEPGLVTLAMAGRRELPAGAVLEHTQTVGDHSLEVVVAPVAARRATSALDILGERLGPHLVSLVDVDVVVDCGRLDQRSPALGLLRVADLVVLVGRPAVSDMVHMGPWVEQLGADRLALVLVGSGRGGQVGYDPQEIADALGVPVLGLLADDASAAARLFAQPGSLVGMWRTRLVRSASDLAASAFAVATQHTVQPSIASQERVIS